jgi:hypothetical protein
MDRAAFHLSSALCTLARSIDMPLHGKNDKERQVSYNEGKENSNG